MNIYPTLAAKDYVPEAPATIHEAAREEYDDVKESDLYCFSDLGLVGVLKQPRNLA